MGRDAKGVAIPDVDDNPTIQELLADHLRLGNSKLKPQPARTTVSA